MFGRDRLLRGQVKERFVVTFKNGGMVSGLLIDVDESVLHFADVKLVQTSGQIPADGQLYVERTNVAYMQRIMTTVKE